MDLEELSRKVSDEIDNYMYQYGEEVIGNPLSAERMMNQLRAFRSALVPPYWIEINVHEHDVFSSPVHRCGVVADDKKGGFLRSTRSTASSFSSTRTPSQIGARLVTWWVLCSGIGEPIRRISGRFT